MRQDKLEGLAPQTELREALLHQQAGRVTEAAQLYSAILNRDPDQVQALLLLGAIRLDDGELASAQTLLQHCCDVAPQNALGFHNLGRVHQRRGEDESAISYFQKALARKPDFPPTFNDIGVSQHRLRQHEAALAAFDHALALDPGYAIAHFNRGQVLLGLDRFADAIISFRNVFACAPESPQTWFNLGLAYYATDTLDTAEECFRHSLALDVGYAEAYLKLAQTLARAHRPAEAERAYVEWARRQGVMVTPCTAPVPEARILLIGGTGACNTPAEFLFRVDRFEKIGVYLMPASEPDSNLASLIERIPPFDVAFNVIGEADEGAPYLVQAAALVDRLDRPVLNPPTRIPATRRDLITQHLGGIPSLVVPDTRRMTRAELAALSADPAPLERTMLVRPAGSHGGTDLTRIESGADLARYLDTMPAEMHYLTSFWDYRSADGYYRKYRLIFVDGEVFPYHLAIAKNWLVHYWRADMLQQPWMRQEEEAFLADYHSVFASECADAVAEVARRLDLDYAGMDCGFTADGQVLLFEANASMLIHLDDPRDSFPYKYDYVPRIFDAVSRMVARRRALAGQVKV